MAFYFSRRRLRPRDGDETGELNIIPYLDILMNLILFMLLSMTGLTAFGILNVNAPSYGGPAAAAPQDPAEAPRMVLSVLIARQGFFVSSDGAAGAPGAGPTLPLTAEGAYDYGALTRQMVALKDAHPTETRVIIAADADVPYETLVQTMDAVRESPGSPRRLLFPDVTLGAL
jgi:biopolymer transport protein TolR